MNDTEKGKMLKNTIKKLYVDEGRSISYIYRLLGINRQVLSNLIKKEWGFTQSNQLRGKIKDFLAQYKDFIIARINEGWIKRQLCESCKVGMSFLNKIFEYDSDIQNAYMLRTSRHKLEQSYIPNEIWKSIFGYENYEVSSYGRVRGKSGIIVQFLNKCGYFYVALTDSNGKRRSVRTHRLVAHAFVSGFAEGLEVNHKDGDKTNNKANNLEWVTKSENARHSFDILGNKARTGKLDFIIIYKDKYEFKTISAFARFLGKSETQTSRYVYENPEKYYIKKVSRNSLL